MATISRKVPKLGSVHIVLIAETLLLVAMTDKGHLPLGSDAYIKVGLTGALLAELAVDGKLTIAQDGRVRLGDTRPDDELLADVYDALGKHLEGKKAKRVVRDLGRHIGGSWNRVVDRLVATGVLGRDRPSILRPTRHPVIDVAGRQAVLDDVRMAAMGERSVRPGTWVVLALAGPCQFLKQVAPDLSASAEAKRRIIRTRGEAKRRIARATTETPFAPSVAETIGRLVSAVTKVANAIGSG